MRRILIILLLISTFYSCYRLEGDFLTNFPDNSGKNKVKMNGYYYYVGSQAKSIYDSITNENIGRQELYWITPLVLYKNGLVYFRYRGITEDKTYSDKLHSLSLPHNKLNNYWNAENNKKIKLKKYCINWGLYRLEEDSIFIEYYDRSWSNIVLRSNKLVLHKLNGVIINDSTIEITRHWGNKQIYHFNKNETKPDSMCFLKLMNKNKD